MATISTSEITGLKLIGNPIVLKVTPANTPSGATFHRAMLQVTVTSSDSRSGTFEFSMPVTGSGALSFDISSALQAVADQYEYGVGMTNNSGFSSYPSYSFTVKAWDEWLKDGEVADNYSSAATASASGFYPGAFSDRERLVAASRPTRWSRKPSSSPEVCFAGAAVLWPGSISSSPSVNVYTIDAANTADTAHNFYTIPFHRDGYEMRFINSLGVHESVHVSCLAQQDMTVKTDKYTIARQETLTSFSRGMTVKQNDHERWKMSSGPLDGKWLQWWLHELLMARYAWLNCAPRLYNANDGKWEMDGAVWLPVHILPDDTVKGFSRQKPDMMEVQFIVEFDINGSPL
jgi:hypothetical protein